MSKPVVTPLSKADEDALWLDVLVPPPADFVSLDDDGVEAWLWANAEALTAAEAEGKLLGKTALDGLRWLHAPSNWPRQDASKVVRKRVDHIVAKVIYQIEDDIKFRRNRDARERAEEQRKVRAEMFKAKGW